MNNHKQYFILLLLFALCFSLYSEDKDASPLMIQQERIQQMIIKLDEKFLRLAESLKEKEPENAKLLLAAFKRSKETLVQLKVEGSIKSLQYLELQKAIDAQQKIIDDLFNILNALTNLDYSNKDEIKRLEELKKKVDKLIREEFGIKNESSKLEDKKQSVEKYEEEIKKLESLIKDSQDTLQKTVENRVKGLSHLSGVAKNLERQSKITEQIFEKIAGFPLDNKNTLPQEKTDDKKLVDEPENKKAEDKLTEPGANELKKSFYSFGQAEKGIMEGKPFSSENSQKEAIGSLQKALEELKNEKDRILTLPENYTDELAKNQDKLREDLEKVKSESEQSKKLNPSDEENKSNDKGEGEKGEGEKKEGEKGEGDKGKGEKGEGEKGEGEKGEGEKAEGDKGEGEKGDGEQGEGEQDKDKKSKPKQAKSQKPFDKAEKYMEESSKNLKDKKIATAKEKQDKTIEELKKIKDNIDKTLAQLRNEEKEEKLAGLENRFLEILQRERIVKDQTIALEKFKEKSEWTRSEIIKCSLLMHEQIALKELVVRAEDILVEDASTIVFPDIVNQLKEDMTFVSDYLKSEKTNKITQSMESEIIQTLEEMVEALQKAREEAKKDAQEGGEGGGGSNPKQLVSESQELKLLRKMQIRVNQMTKLFKDESKNSDLPDSKKDLKRIYDKQKQVLDITRKINERKQ